MEVHKITREKEKKKRSKIKLREESGPKRKMRRTR